MVQRPGGVPPSHQTPPNMQSSSPSSYMSGNTGSPVQPAPLPPPPGASPIRRPSGSGVASPATGDRPLTPRTPGSAGRLTPSSSAGGRQTPSTPGGQPAPSPDQQVGGGGGGNPNHPMIPAVPMNSGWDTMVFGLKGGGLILGPVAGGSVVSYDNNQRRLGGWGYFFGLKGGGSPDNTNTSPGVSHATTGGGSDQINTTTIPATTISALTAQEAADCPGTTAATVEAAAVRESDATTASAQVPESEPASVGESKDKVASDVVEGSCVPVAKDPPTTVGQQNADGQASNAAATMVTAAPEASHPGDDGLNTAQEVSNQPARENSEALVNNGNSSEQPQQQLQPSQQQQQPTVTDGGVSSQAMTVAVGSSPMAVTTSSTTVQVKAISQPLSTASMGSAACSATVISGTSTSSDTMASIAISSSSFTPMPSVSLPGVDPYVTGTGTSVRSLPVPPSGGVLTAQAAATGGSTTTTAAAAGPRLAAPGGVLSSGGNLGVDQGMAQNALLKQLLSSSTVTPKAASSSSGVGMTDTSPVKTASSGGCIAGASGAENMSDIDRFKQLPKQVLSTMASQLPNPQASTALENPLLVPPGGSGVAAPVSCSAPTPPSSTSGSLVHSAQYHHHHSQQQQASPLLAQQLSSASTGPMPQPPSGLPHNIMSMSPGRADQPASLQEGLAGMLAENSHRIPMAPRLPNQPVPPSSLTGVVQVQPGTTTMAQQQPYRPQYGGGGGGGVGGVSQPQAGMMMGQQQQQQQQQQPHMTGGIQNLLQSQVPIPPGQLGGPVNPIQQQQLQHHQHMQQQQQQQALYQQQQQRMQQEQMMRQQQLQMQSQHIRMQHHQQQQQAAAAAGMVPNNSFEPPQQMVGAGVPMVPQQQQRIGAPHPGAHFPLGQPGGVGMMPRQINPMQQMINQVSNANLRHQQQQQHPMAGMGPAVPGGVVGRMAPGGPGSSPTGGLRLNIPPHAGAMSGGGPTSAGGLPCTPGSALPSPSLTPRSVTSERDDDMDTGSSRGPTPGSDRMDGGSITPDLTDKAGGHHKRRPSVQQQQKRRISAQDSSPGKNKRPRKGSQLQDGAGGSNGGGGGAVGSSSGGDYDNYIDSVVHQLKSLPPLPTVEPRLSHCFNACSVYGTGDIAKVLSKENEAQRCLLEGRYGAAGLPAEGDYYASMPFGPEPPVPYVAPLSVNSRGFYSQEFAPERRTETGTGTSPVTTRPEGHLSPDLFYSSSPEPDLVPKKRRRAQPPPRPPASKAELQRPEDGSGVIVKQEVIEETSGEGDTTVQIKKEAASDYPEPAQQAVVEGGEAAASVNESLCWYDLEPEDTDDELELTGGLAMFGPPNIMSRPSSPGVGLVQPIPVRPRPGQSITLSDLDGLRITGDKENSKKKERESGGRKGGRKAEQRQMGLLSLSGSLGVTPSPLKERSDNNLTQVIIIINHIFIFKVQTLQYARTM